MARSITLLNWFTEPSRLMVPDSSNQMTSLADSGFITKGDHQNIKMLAALLFKMPAHYLFNLKIHLIGMATFYKKENAA